MKGVVKRAERNNLRGLRSKGLTLDMRANMAGQGAKQCVVVGLRDGPVERSRADWRMCHMSRVDPISSDMLLSKASQPEARRSVV